MGWSWKRFDRAGRLIETREYAGAAKPPPWGANPSQLGSSVYSYAGAAITASDAASHARTSVIDALGRLASVSSAGLISASYEYNVLDSLTKVTQTDPSTFGGTVTQSRMFEYDELQRLKSTIQPESGVTAYEYYDNGILKKKTDARGVSTTYALDAKNRVQTKTFSDVIQANLPNLKTPQVLYCYDGQSYDPGTGACTGTVPRTTDYSFGSLTGYGSRRDGVLIAAVNHPSIDALGRIVASAHYLPGLNATSGTTAPPAFAYEYNLGGLLTKLTYPSGRVVEYTPTVANRVATVKRNATQNYLSSAAYSAAGELTAAAFGVSAYTQSWSYNALGQLKNTEASKSGNLLLGLTNIFTPTYDAATLAEAGSVNNGNLHHQRIQYKKSDNTTATVMQDFGYDNANRLSSFGEPGKSQNFGYDGFGNIRQTGQTGIAAQQQLAQVAPSWYQSGSNQISGVTFDAAGQPLHEVNDAVRVMRWDAEGRLASLAVSGIKAAESYEYDGDGGRISRTVGGVTTYYVHDASGQLMAEYSAGSGLALGTTTARYLISDHLQSTRLVVDDTGACAERLDYLPFGTLNVRAAGDCYGGTSGVQQRFTGATRDSELGLDFMEARYYSGMQARLMSPDEPLLYSDRSDPASWNLYAYGMNNPLLYTDPSGHFAEREGGPPPGLNPLDELLYRAFLNSLDNLQRAAQLGQQVLETTWDSYKRPRNNLCMAGSIAAGASIGGYGGGVLGLGGGPAAVVTVPAVSGGGALLGGGLGGLAGMFSCSVGSGGGGDHSEDTGTRQLQAKFKHAGDFGISGNWTKQTAQGFGKAIERHVGDAATKAIRGTYRGQAVTHYVNPQTGLNVMKDTAGNFVSGWKLNAQQLQNVLTRGSL